MDFGNSAQAMQEAHEEGLRHFAKWLAKHWVMRPSAEEWARTNADPYPGDDYITGYNAGIEGIDGALDLYIEESR